MRRCWYTYIDCQSAITVLTMMSPKLHITYLSTVLCVWMTVGWWFDSHPRVSISWVMISGRMQPVWTIANLFPHLPRNLRFLLLLNPCNYSCIRDPWPACTASTVLENPFAWRYLFLPCQQISRVFCLKTCDANATSPLSPTVTALVVVPGISCSFFPLGWQ